MIWEYGVFGGLNGVRYSFGLALNALPYPSDCRVSRD